MDNYRSRRPHSIFLPLLLVLIGVLLLMVNLGTIHSDAWEILATYWPLIFVLGGLDSLYRGEGWVGAVVSIGLGTVLLLGNLHYLQWGSLELLMRLWPILLVAWGLDIAFGRNSSVWSVLLRVFFGLALIGGIIWLSIVSPFGGALKTVPFQQTLDSAQRSALDLSMTAGELDLAGGAPADMLVEGTLSLPRDMTLTPEYTAPSGGASQLKLEGSGVVIFPVGTSEPWNLKLNSTIPFDVTSRLGAGDMTNDFSEVKVDQLDSELAVGRSVVTLPRFGAVSGKVQVAVGELLIRVPKGKSVILHINTGVVAKDLPTGYSQSNGVITSNGSSEEADELWINLAVGNLVVEEIQ